ncbi:hypothetical protein ACVWWG_003305 [Bradyrhizobium sp. LB7.2]
MSSMISAECSIPIERRIVSGKTPATRCCSADICRCVVDAGWRGQRLGIADIDQARDQLQRIVEGLSCFHAALDAKGEQRGRVAVEIFLHQRIIGTVRETGVVDPGDARVLTQEFGDLAGILAVALHAQRHGLDALDQQEGVERRQHRTHGALIDAPRALDIGSAAEALGIDEAVVRGVRLVVTGEAVRVPGPGEVAGIDDGAAERGAVAAQEFGQRMHGDVGAVIERLEQDWGCNRIVHDQRHTVRVSDLCQRLDIADIAGGIADGFGEHGAGVLVDQLFDRLRLVALGKAAGDALPRQDVREQRMRGAVELRHGNDVAAVIGDVDEGEMQRRLPGRDRKRADAALKLGDTLFQHRAGRIGDAAVAIAFGLEIEERRAVIGAVEGVSRGLVDRHGNRVRGGFGLVAGVNSDRLVAHRATSAWSGPHLLACMRHVRCPPSLC